MLHVHDAPTCRTCRTSNNRLSHVTRGQNSESGSDLKLEQMARFEDLPLDLLPEIIVHLLIPVHLTSLCLVSRTVYSFSVPNLYRRIVILPLHKSSKSRVCIIFSIFSEGNSLTSCHAGNKFIQNSRGVSQPRLPCAPIRFASHALQNIYLHEYG